MNRADLERAMRECGNEFAPAIVQPDGYADGFFSALGAARLETMDASAYEGASLVHDLNHPVAPELHRRCSLVFDGGTLEHVFNVPAGFANAMSMVEVGGHFIGITVCNNYVGHGLYQFSPEFFFRVLSPENGFEVRSIFVFETKTAGLDDGIAYRVKDPAVLGRRVLLANSAETLIAVCARRVADLPIFANPPQQSDYVEYWHAGEGNAIPSGELTLKERTRPLRYGLKRGVRKLTSWVPKLALDRYDPEGFERVRLDASLLSSL